MLAYSILYPQITQIVSLILRNLRMKNTVGMLVA
jgi:hypothetical protein